MAQTPVAATTWFLLLLLLLGSSTAGNNSTCRKVGPPLSNRAPNPARSNCARCVCMPAQVRIATFNTSLNRNADNQLLIELRSGVSAQAANVSAILQSIRPDVLILNEFDYVADEAAIRAFQHFFLSVSQAPGLEPLRQVHAQSTLSTHRCGGTHTHPQNATCLTLPDWGFPCTHHPAGTLTFSARQSTPACRAAATLIMTENKTGRRTPLGMACTRVRGPQF